MMDFLQSSDILLGFIGAILVIIGWLFIRRKAEFQRSINMVFLRVVVARKDSDSDERKETVKDFREQISIMEQLLA